MIKITTAQDGAGTLYDQGVRSWHEGLSDQERAQLRAIEATKNLQPYASLGPNSNTYQQHGQTSGVLHNGMAQDQAQVKTTSPAGPTETPTIGPIPTQVQSPVQESVALWQTPSSAGYDAPERQLDWGAVQDNGTFNFAQQATQPSSVMPSVGGGQDMTNMYNAANNDWQSQYRQMMQQLNQDIERQGLLG